MSLNSLSNESIRQQIRSAGSRKVGNERSITTDAEGETQVENNSANATIDTLTKFIPSEILALYVAFIGAATTSQFNNDLLQISYWVAVIATPLLFAFLHFVKLAAAGPIPNLLRSDKLLLLWRALASMISFAIWGISIPQSAYHSLISEQFVGFLALFVTIILGGLDVIIGRILSR